LKKLIKKSCAQVKLNEKVWKACFREYLTILRRHEAVAKPTKKKKYPPEGKKEEEEEKASYDYN